jgi:hypothetical protein
MQIAAFGGGGQEIDFDSRVAANGSMDGRDI